MPDNLDEATAPAAEDEQVMLAIWAAMIVVGISALVGLYHLAAAAVGVASAWDWQGAGQLVYDNPLPSFTVGCFALGAVCAIFNLDG